MELKFNLEKFVLIYKYVNKRNNLRGEEAWN